MSRPTTCRVTVTSHEWLWLRDIKCGAPVGRYGLCARHAADRDRLTGRPHLIGLSA